MPKTPLQDYRNIGIIAHIDAGKTTTTERILYYTGMIHKMGNIDDGNTTMDFMPQEQERGITITAANITTYWKDKQINIIDTPGHVDFTIEVERSLKVLDGAVIVLCGTSGVQPQTETVWRQADRYGVPRIAFVNKLDRLGASYERVLGQIKDRLGANAAPIFWPDGTEEKLKGIIDIVEGKYFLYMDDLGEKIDILDVPEQFKDKIAELRHDLIEKLSDADDVIMQKFLDEKPISNDELKAGIRRAVIACKFLPVLCGSSLKNKGVQSVLDAVVAYLPSPLDIPPIKGKMLDTQEEISRPPDPKAPLSALVFKLANDPYVGKLFYTRIYSGTLTAGDQVFNSTTQQKERLAKIVVMHAKKQEIVEKAEAGDIVALVGLKDFKTGNTLCHLDNKVILESLRVPEPVVSMSIEPKTKADSDKLGLVLRKFLDEDPSLQANYNHETGQTILSGMGELHLEIIIDRMKREFGLDTNIGRPEVAYKETITRPVMDIDGKFVQQSGGRGQYGHVVINAEPLPKGSGFEFVDNIKGGAIPREYVPAARKGFQEAILSGMLAGYPVTDIRITLIDGSYHDVDSSEMAFQLAARLAFKEAMAKGRAVFLEPIMRVEIECPEEQMSSVIGDLNSRRAKILNMGTRSNLKTAECEVPLSEMFNYVNALRSLTQGRGTYSMEPAYYEQVPGNVSEKIIGARQQAGPVRR